jgi:hypothetical protein
MRIRGIHIDVFGGLRERDLELGPGLNVFYGPNESGKTTVMEFVRTVLVPSNKRNLYPERSKKDSGSITYEDGGSQKTLVLDRGSVSGEVPDCVSGLDPELYRSVFAMDLNGLNDMAPVADDEIRSRFLTVPGGDRVPALLESIEDDVSGIAGKTAASKSELNANRGELNSLYSRIAELRSKAESYSELKAKEAELEEELRSISESNGSAQENNELYARVESQRPAFAQLADLKSRRAQLSSGVTVSQEEKETYSRLSGDVAERSSSYNAVNESRKDLLKKFPGGDDSIARSNRDAVRGVLDRRSEYMSRRSRPLEVKQPPSKIRLPLTVILLAAAVASFVLIPGDVIVRATASAVLVAAAAGAFLLLKGGHTSDSGNAAWLQRYESEVSSVAGRCGIQPSSTERQLEVLSDMESSMSGLDALKGSLNECRMEKMSAENRLLGFLTRFGGEEGYRKAVRDSEELARVDSAIYSVRKGISDSGFDPDSPLPEVSRVDVDQARGADTGRELGALRERMKAVLDTDELDSCIDRCYMLRRDQQNILRRGAVAMLSSAIVQEACDGQYSEVRPGVVSTADRYLGMMTMDSYHLDTDPRSKTIQVVSGGVIKGPKQWSTGLRAQVMLSIKLAVAKELGSGEVPVLLDDVLLPFDSERKDGACRALVQVSKEMQILLFTCDERIASKLGGSEDVSIIRMRPERCYTLFIY